MRIAKWKSDYDPDTTLTIVQTADGDICLRIHGNGEMRFATSGGKLHGADLDDITASFREIMRIINKNEISN